MWLQGVQFNNIEISPFSISKFEVSNKEYQEFLDNGGYTNPKFWDFPIIIGIDLLTLNQRVKFFTGKYGKPGPAKLVIWQIPKWYR